MAKIEFDCPECKKTNNLFLMGNDKGIFEQKCKTCNTNLEIENSPDGIQVKPLQKILKRNYRQFDEEIKKNIPPDYKKYDFEEPNKKTAKFIAILILTSSLMGLFTGYILLDFFDRGYEEFEIIEIEIVAKNNTSDLENIKIILDGKEINSTYTGNGTYNIMAKPGKHTIEITALNHKKAIMNVFLPPQDSNLTLIDVEEGIEGVNRFTFSMQEGEGEITLEESTYIKMESWCPNLIFLFSLIGIWGSWVTYNLQSYNNAQIGAFFSVLAMGFFIIGPILGIIALYYLKKNKEMFTASFKN